MAAYLIANVQITDAAEFEEYRRRVPAVIAAYGGHYLARGGTIEEFEIALRQRCARSRLFAVEGI